MASAPEAQNEAVLGVVVMATVVNEPVVVGTRSREGLRRYDSLSDAISLASSLSMRLRALLPSQTRQSTVFLHRC